MLVPGRGCDTCQDLRQESLAYQCRTFSFIHSLVHSLSRLRYNTCYIYSQHLLNAGEVLLLVRDGTLVGGGGSGRGRLMWEGHMSTCG